MKKQFFLFAAATLLAISSLMAQEGRQRQTPAEKTKVAMEKMVVLNLDADTKTKTEVIITEFYEAQQKAMKEMRASGNMDKEAMMAQRQKLANERDAKLKLIFTQEQLKKWIDEIEPSLKPQKAVTAPAN